MHYKSCTPAVLERVGIDFTGCEKLLLILPGAPARKSTMVENDQRGVCVTGCEGSCEGAGFPPTRGDATRNEGSHSLEMRLATRIEDSHLLEVRVAATIEGSNLLEARIATKIEGFHLQEVRVNGTQVVLMAGVQLNGGGSVAASPCRMTGVTSHRHARIPRGSGRERRAAIEVRSRRRSLLAPTHYQALRRTGRRWC